MRLGVTPGNRMGIVPRRRIAKGAVLAQVEVVACRFDYGDEPVEPIDCFSGRKDDPSERYVVLGGTAS